MPCKLSMVQLRIIACQFKIRNLSVYHTPALAISAQVQSCATTFLRYHSGYFHWNILFFNVISLLSFNGDSPSPKIVSPISKCSPWNNGLSPV